MDDTSKKIRVVAAVICDSLENPAKIFATSRGYGDIKGQWEFPGGKIEVGETSPQALIREIKEELAVQIKVGEQIDTIEYDYPTFHLSMDCFWCVVVNGEIILKEAEDARWFKKKELYSVNWLPADIILIKKIQNSLLPCESKMDDFDSCNSRKAR
jgi:8-oxo-dGTP diphosphatase